jgi:C4-dicarboxylate transporter, DctQ subunit
MAMNTFGKMLRAIEKTEESLVIFSVVLALALCCVQVTARYAFNYPLSWPEELIRYLIILIVYVGASIAVRKKSHISVDIIYTFFPHTKKILHYLSTGLGIVFSFLIIIYGMKFVKNLVASGQIAITLKIPIFIVYSILPIGGLLLLLQYILQLSGADKVKSPGPGSSGKETANG